MKSTCTLPSLSEVLTLPSVSCQRGHSRKTYVHPSRIAHNEQFAYSPCIYDDAPLSSMTADQFFEDDEPVKKRKRATPSQLHVLNSVFVRTHFPSTELRMKIGKQLGMSPRTVQIWFQNKRQSRRTKEKSSNNQLMSPPISP
ncbi:Homeodomain-like protein, partial [Mycotypha africana]|uniref:Homeodomain-like protein n=1 Tax=Mycotypha africana TaxID=64632 RepID=UPI0022FFF813